MRSTFVVFGLLGCVGIAQAAPTAFHDAVSSDGPVLWYRFGEAPGTTTIANSGSLGSAFDGTAINGPMLGEPTLSGDTGVLFNRATSPSFVSNADVPASLLVNPDFTCEAIINIDEAAGGTNYAPFLFWGDNGTGRSVYFSIRRDDAQLLYAGFYNGGPRVACPYTSDGWLHIVWTRDSAGGTNNVIDGSRVWVNGIEVPLIADKILCCNDAEVDIQPGPFRIQRANDFVRHWSGVMDEVVLYDRALTEAEVQEHYAATGINEPYEDCPADINLTCSVDPADFTAWLGCFNDPASQDYCGRADVNQSGSIEPSDFTAWLGAFNSGCD